MAPTTNNEVRLTPQKRWLIFKREKNDNINFSAEEQKSRKKRK